jgi:hypothetical protein
MNGFFKRLSWENVSKYQKFSIAFGKRHMADIQWQYVPVLKYGRVFIRTFAPFLNWEVISANPILFGEQFLTEFGHYLNWETVVKKQQVTESILRSFKDLLVTDDTWLTLSHYHHLSEAFIEEFAHRVSWPFIFAYQKLTPEFVAKHDAKFDLLEILAAAGRTRAEIDEVQYDLVLAQYMNLLRP